MTASGIRRLSRRFVGPVARRSLLVVLVAVAWVGWHLGPLWPLTRWSRPSEIVSSATLSPNGTKLLAIEAPRHPIAFGSPVDPYHLWDLASGQEVLAVDDPRFVSTDQVFAPDDSWLAAQDSRGIIVWDTADGHRRLTIPPSEKPWTQPWRPFTVTSDGRTLACRFDDGGSVGIQLWNLTAGRLVATLAHADYPMAFAPDGRTLATASSPDSRNPVLLWDVATGREIGRFGDASFGGVAELAFSPDGRQLAVASPSWGEAHERSRMTIAVWDLASKRPRTTVTVKFYPQKSVDWVRPPLVFSPDGRYLVLRTTGTGLFSDLSTDPPRNLDSLLADTGVNTDGPPNSLRYPLFNPTGTRFLVPRPEHGSLVVHDAATLVPLVVHHIGGLGIETPVFSPDGRWVAILGGGSLARPLAWQVWIARLLGQPDTFFRPRSYARLIDLTTGAEAGRVPCGATLLGFSADSRSLWSYSQSAVLEVEQWAVPSPWPPLWLVSATAIGVLLIVVDWRRSRRHVVTRGRAS
jgi:WD40 repeat protein